LMGAGGRAGGAAGSCVTSESDGMEVTAFVPEAADGCWTIGWPSSMIVTVRYRKPGM
jgi:hypothetical protein